MLAIYWLKYSPNKIAWPAPIELINVVISGIIGLFAVVGLLFALGIGSFGLGILGVGGGFLGGVYLLFVAAAIAYTVGAGMMFLGTWREYQAMPKTASPSTPSAPPPPPSRAPERAAQRAAERAHRLTQPHGRRPPPRAQLPNGGPGSPGPLCFRRPSRSPTAFTPAPATSSPAATSTAT